MEEAGGVEVAGAGGVDELGGLAAYCVFGASKALVVTGSATIAIVTGVMTATFDGIVRYIAAQEPSVLLRPEIYVTAALVGGTTFSLLAILGALAAFAVRGSVLWFGWTFPPCRSRPGRRPEDVM